MSGWLWSRRGSACNTCWQQGSCYLLLWLKKLHVAGAQEQAAVGMLRYFQKHLSVMQTTLLQTLSRTRQSAMYVYYRPLSLP